MASEWRNSEAASLFRPDADRSVGTAAYEEVWGCAEAVDACCVSFFLVLCRWDVDESRI